MLKNPRNWNQFAPATPTQDVVEEARLSSSFLFFRITFTYQGVADQKTSEILGTYDRLEKVWSHVRTSI
jgi:hypothetical protein